MSSLDKRQDTINLSELAKSILKQNGTYDSFVLLMKAARIKDTETNNKVNMNEFNVAKKMLEAAGVEIPKQLTDTLKYGKSKGYSVHKDFE